MDRDLYRNAAIALLIGGTIGAAFGTWQGRWAWTAAVEQLQRDTLLATDKLELLLRNMRLGAEAVASRLDPDALAESAGNAWPAIERENLGLSTVLVLDETGTVMADMVDRYPIIGMDFSDRTYFRAIETGGVRDYYLGAPILTRPTGAWALPMSVPVTRPDGSFAGIVVGAVVASYFERLDWQTIDADSSVFMHLGDSNTVINATAPGTSLPVAEVIGAEFANRRTASEDAELEAMDIPGMVAFQADSASSRFQVVVAKDRAAIRIAARMDGVLSGGAMALLVGGLLLIALQARLLATRRAADAAQLRFLGERLRMATEAGNIGIWDLDLKTGVNTWNGTMCAMYGLQHEAVEQDYASWRDMVHPDDVDASDAKFRAALADGREFDDVFRILRHDGRERLLKARAVVLTDAAARPIRAVGVNLDITEQAHRERDLIDAHNRIQHDSLHDPLTQLGNRRALAEHLEALVREEPAEARIALIQLDLDRFKAVNDLFGHAAGDHLLIEVAAILERTTRAEDALFRLGGDEFAVVLSRGDIAAAADAAAARIVAACRQPVVYQDKELHFTASIGICVGPVAEANDLIGNADIALYEAKNAGRNQSALFTPELRRRAEDKKRLADKLTEAMSEDHITLRFQPQVWTATRTLAGAEALVRWQHADLGELSPGHFLPVAEELGILHEIDDLILTKTVAAARRMAAHGLTLPRISVNASPRRIMQPDLLDRIDALGELPCPLAFELIETIDFDGVPDEMMGRIKQIAARGIEIEVDDFGTGRASITTLLRVQPDRVKIDRQLVTADVLSGRKAQSVLRAITDMAEALGIPVTAEGVETEAHAKRAADLGCDMMQGFLFSRPLTEAEFLIWARGKGEEQELLAR